MIGLGQYRICREYQHFEVYPSQWFTALNKKQKESFKFQQASVDDKQSSSKNDSRLNKTTSEDLIEWSVDIQTAATVTGLPLLTLREIWAKAGELALCHGQVLPAPGSPPQSHMVASKTQKPHFVSYASDGRFECDETCEGFKQRYICAHTVAAAEDNQMLKNFSESYAQFSKTPKGHRSTTPNFTRLSISNLPHRTAGQKGGKPLKKKAICHRNTISS